MKVFAAILAFFGFSTPAVAPPASPPPPTYLVRDVQVLDEKAVFATIESTYTVPARVRASAPLALAMPKSSSFTCPSYVTMMFFCATSR